RLWWRKAVSNTHWFRRSWGSPGECASANCFGNKRNNIMAHYLFQGTYSSDSWKTLIKKPVNRFDAIRPAIEKLGGSIEGAWLAFGDYDVVLIAEMPDNVSAAAFALAVAAAGSLKTFKTR